MTIGTQNLSSLADDQSIEHQKVVNLVRMWGDLNTDGILDSSCEIFITPEVDGLIGYRACFGHAVVYGDPICAPSEKPVLAQAFQHYCHSKKLGVVYTITSEDFAKWMAQNLSAVTIEFGEKLILDPTHNPINKTGPKAGLIRIKVMHAISEVLGVEEYKSNDQEIKQGIENVAAQWLQNRNGRQIYMTHVTLFESSIGKRWFYAYKNGNILGIVVLNELKSQEAWLLNNLMTTREAPNGTSELLIVSALQILEKENCQRVVIGPIPSTKVGNVDGLGALKTQIARLSYKFLINVFKLSGQGVFWEKFQPASETTFIGFPEQNLSYSSIKALLGAYNASIL
jgi:lysylphosphatidylglycerol synthetase-like protein (DUF2156 family)